MIRYSAQMATLDFGQEVKKAPRPLYYPSSSALTSERHSGAASGEPSIEESA